MSNDDYDFRQLQLHQQQVEAFGGRIQSITDEQILNELKLANLGSGSLLLTSQPNALFQSTLPKVVTLAEMNLSRPIAVDVSFAYQNELMPGFSNPFTSPPNAIQGLHPGNGFVRITWGVNGAIQHTADVDGAQGWRFPFVASFLRVEYVPIDVNSSDETNIIGDQARDLGLTAMISPASGAPCMPLTKTQYFPIVIPPQQVRYQPVPRWARNFRLVTWATGRQEFQIFAFETPFSVNLNVDSNILGAPLEWPQWTAKSRPWPITQNTKFIFLSTTFLPNDTTLFNSEMIFELAL